MKVLMSKSICCLFRSHWAMVVVGEPWAGARLAATAAIMWRSVEGCHYAKAGTDCKQATATSANHPQTVRSRVEPCA